MARHLMLGLTLVMPMMGQVVDGPASQLPPPSASPIENRGDVGDGDGLGDGDETTASPWLLAGDTLRVRRQGRGVPSKGVQDAYLAILQGWVAPPLASHQGGSHQDESHQDVVAALSDLQQELLATLNDRRVFDALRADPGAALQVGESGAAITTLVFTGFECLKQLEGHHLEVLSQLAPASSLALAELYRQVVARQVQAPQRLWLVAHNQERLVAAIGRSSQEEATVVAPKDRALLWIAYGELLQRTGFYHHGVQALRQFERALEVSPEHGAARYWSGFLAEKYDFHRRAVAHFQLLVNGFVSPEPSLPLAAESRLRLAVNHLRIGKRRLAMTGLQQTARQMEVGQRELWIRQVAYQEWGRAVQGHSTRGKTSLGDVLEEALEVFPEDAALRLLAAYELQGQDWQEGLEALQDFEQRAPGTDLSPRRRYETPRDAGLDRSLEDHRQRVATWRAELGQGLVGLHELYAQGASRPVFAGCERLVVER